MQLALGVEYDGGAFNGYQLQPNVPTVQQALQDALSRVAAGPVTLHAAGRTDTGVHATGQVVSFTTAALRPPSGWQRGANSLTPDSLTVTWVQEVEPDFHPRFSATARRYMYLFYESAWRSPLLDPYAVASSRLDDGQMDSAARALLGEHDFSTFRAAGCQSRTPYRRVDQLRVHRCESLVVIDITANAFLLHMVRNIAGALWQVGRGERDSRWLGEILTAAERRLAGPTAPPHGLYLVNVAYPGQDFPSPPLPGPLRSLGGLDRFA